MFQPFRVALRHTVGDAEPLQEGEQHIVPLSRFPRHAPAGRRQGDWPTRYPLDEATAGESPQRLDDGDMGHLKVGRKGTHSTSVGASGRGQFGDGFHIVLSALGEVVVSNLLKPMGGRGGGH